MPVVRVGAICADGAHNDAPGGRQLTFLQRASASPIYVQHHFLDLRRRVPRRVEVLKSYPCDGVHLHPVQTLMDHVSLLEKLIDGSLRVKTQPLFPACVTSERGHNALLLQS